MTKEAIIASEACALYFKSHPQAESGIFTSDGMPFHDTKTGKLSAETHARSNKLEVHVVKRTDLDADSTEQEEAEETAGAKKTSKKTDN